MTPEYCTQETYISLQNWCMHHSCRMPGQLQTKMFFRCDQPQTIKNTSYFSLHLDPYSSKHLALSFFPPNTQYWYAGGARYTTTNSRTVSGVWYPCCTNENVKRTWMCQINVIFVRCRSISECFENVRRLFPLSFDSPPDANCLSVDASKNTAEFSLWGYRKSVCYLCLGKIRAARSTKMPDGSHVYGVITYISRDMLDVRARTNDLWKMIRASQISGSSHTRNFSALKT